MKTNFSPRAVCILALTLALSAWPLPLALGEVDFDPQQPLRWEEMLTCERVFLGKYREHKDKVLSLEVMRVLKGNGLKPGDVVAVSLEHRYSVETGFVGWESWTNKDKKPDGIPKLCYKQQLMNPGDLVPIRVIADVREPGLYFLPKAGKPELKRLGQVQDSFLIEGWKQALDGRPMVLTFRLVQRVDPGLQRKALEELHAGRDAATLDRLFDWIVNPPPVGDYREVGAADIILKIGDKQGDVYDRAWTRLKSENAGTNPYRFGMLARIMALANGERAWEHFGQVLKGPSLPLKQAVAGAVGHLHTEKALELSFNLLRDAELAKYAKWSLHELIHSAPRGPNGQETLVRLREVARPKYVEALASPQVAEPIKNELRGSFRHLYEKPPELDWERAEKILLNPQERCYHGWAEGEGHQMYQQIIPAGDPRAVPLLIRVLREVPATRGNRAAMFKDALLYYARLCPNAMRREVAKHGLDKELSALPQSDGYDVRVRFLAVLGLPRTVQQFKELTYQPGARAWLAKKQPVPELIAALEKFLEHYIADSAGPPHGYLLPFLEVAPEQAKPLLEKALSRRGSYRAAIRAEILATAVKHGRDDLLDELLASIAPVAVDEKKHGHVPASATNLLVSGHPKAHAEYLKILDATRSLQRYSQSQQQYLSLDYKYLLQALFRDHAGDYFARITALLESELLPERDAGAKLLDAKLHWNFGFDAHDFADVRAQRLAALRGVLKKLGAMTETQMRAYVLSQHSVTLEGPPGKGWLPALKKAATSLTSAVSQNALILIDEITGEYGCSELHTRPPAERERALAAYLQDRAIIVPDK